MTRKPMPSEKACVDCGTTFSREGASSHRWRATKRCALCRVEELKRRIRQGSPPDENGCWIWKGSTRNGYGQISVNDETTYTHRLSFELFRGPIPADQEVCHTCDVRRCNNPEHFFLGTHIENIEDMRQKGRGTKPPTHRGSTHPQAKLTDDQVAEIRALVAGGAEQRDVAKQFGCSQSTVWRLAHKVTRS